MTTELLDMYKYVDESIDRSDLAERVELPSENWRAVLFRAEAYNLTEQLIDAFKDGVLNVSYGEMVELIETCLDFPELIKERLTEAS